MPRISHIAIKVRDLDEATKFYTEVFGFRAGVEVGHEAGADHVSRHLTDGHIDIALIAYDSEDSDEAKLAGPGPCIHHIGIEVEDHPAYVEKIREYGGEFLTLPRYRGKLYKFRAPDGTLSEIMPTGFFDMFRGKKSA